jgi:hypothetical protein
MTKSQRMRDSAVMISSTIPSAKYSCSGFTAQIGEGKDRDRRFVGKGKRTTCNRGSSRRVPPLIRYALIGWAMFLTCCPSRSVKDTTVCPDLIPYRT